MHVVQSGSNLGFAGGNDFGLKYCNGDYIYLLNNDTILEKDCVEELVLFMERDPKIAAAQSKMVLLNDREKLDVVGSFWTNTGFLFHFGYQGDAAKKAYNEPLKVFSNKGASMMLRKSAIDKVGFFDEDFWCYYEETDLCHRLWLVGYECWYAPKAVMYHAGGGTSLTFDNSYIQFHNFKNKLLSFVKNFEVATLLKFIFIYFAINMLLSIYWLFSGKPKHFLALYKAIGWNVKQFPRTLAKRREIQAMRTRSDREILRGVQRNPGADYYVDALTGRLGRYANKA